jgi:hypothetical protein
MYRRCSWVHADTGDKWWQLVESEQVVDEEKGKGMMQRR